MCKCKVSPRWGRVVVWWSSWLECGALGKFGDGSCKADRTADRSYPLLRGVFRQRTEKRTGQTLYMLSRPLMYLYGSGRDKSRYPTTTPQTVPVSKPCYCLSERAWTKVRPSRFVRPCFGTGRNGESWSSRPSSFYARIRLSSSLLTVLLRVSTLRSAPLALLLASGSPAYRCRITCCTTFSYDNAPSGAVSNIPPRTIPHHPLEHAW